jgi:hypothetical protein
VQNSKEQIYKIRTYVRNVRVLNCNTHFHSRFTYSKPQNDQLHISVTQPNTALDAYDISSVPNVHNLANLKWYAGIILCSVMTAAVFLHCVGYTAPALFTPEHPSSWQGDYCCKVAPSTGQVMTIFSSHCSE